MNWKLIVQLSLFGLAMGILTVFLPMPPSLEMVFWLFIFVICAYVIGKQAPGRYFQHGMMVSVLNSFWIVAAHVLLFKQYIAGHPEQARTMAIMPLSNQPRLLMIVTGLFVGVVSGAVLGVFAVIAKKLLTEPTDE